MEVRNIGLTRVPRPINILGRFENLGFWTAHLTCWAWLKGFLNPKSTTKITMDFKHNE